MGAAVVAATLAAGGCGASGNSASSDGGDARRDAAAPAQKPGAADRANPGNEGSVPQKPNAPAAPGAPKAPTAPRAPSQLHIIRTTELQIQVSDATASLMDARTTAESVGGYVGNESTERDSRGHIYSRISLRVPQDKYSETLTALERATLKDKGAKFLGRKSDAKDVTNEVVDTESAIKSQRISVARVQDLMNRADKLTDIVSLEAELANRQGELDRLMAQQASLKERTAMATITLVVSEAPPKKAAPKPPVEDEPGFLDALDGGWQAFLTTVRWIAMVLGAVAPFAVTLVLLYLLWRRLIAPHVPRRTHRAPAFPHHPTNYPSGPGHRPETWTPSQGASQGSPAGSASQGSPTQGASQGNPPQGAPAQAPPSRGVPAQGTPAPETPAPNPEMK
ncbi:DUF4349 domain-containing protein [Streptomyces sp. NPDC051561]|uniref:DUF4349 domain-containing protein n=1 Tax=Streptomyces sp. NPDC051561 TaxID=3365658 RepID=UPI0037B6AF69